MEERPGIAIIAFDGWNDAADAATATVSHLADTLDAETVGSIESEGYVDFQVNRPLLTAGEDGRRELVWPDTHVSRLTGRTREPLLVVSGPEPSFRWRAFSRELMEVLRREDVGTVICLGAMLADVPHTRPIPVTVSALASHPGPVDGTEGAGREGTSAPEPEDRSAPAPEDASAPAPEDASLPQGATEPADSSRAPGATGDAPEFGDTDRPAGEDGAAARGTESREAKSPEAESREAGSHDMVSREAGSHDVEAADADETGAMAAQAMIARYEGPTGIPTVVQDAAAAAGMRTFALWAQVPHYVGQTPSPKAVYALVRALQHHLETPIPLGELPDDAEAWQRGVDELAESDPEIGAYVKRLEQVQDAAELPESTGEAIAAEFEQFLRRRDEE